MNADGTCGTGKLRPNLPAIFIRDDACQLVDRGVFSSAFIRVHPRFHVSPSAQRSQHSELGTQNYLANPFASSSNCFASIAPLCTISRYLSVNDSPAFSFAGPKQSSAAL